MGKSKEEEEDSMTTYYCGVDLGTSRTSICTSTGKRVTVDTCVGYPKDVISQKRFKKPYLLGKEAIDNRLALNMVWPLADGVIASEEAIKSVRLILQNLIRYVFPDIKPKDEIYSAVGVPAQASVESKKDIIHAVKDILHKVLIVSEPFMVAYGMDIFDEALIIDIGAGCVTGDTKISLMDGREVPIKKLAGKSDFYVYSYDHSTNTIVPGRVRKCGRTIRNAKLVEVTLDNNETIRCTPDHPFLTRNRRYVEAQKLKVGDSIMPLYRRENSRGYEELLQPKGHWETTHRMVYNWKYGGLIPRAAICHHKSFNKRDNDPRHLLAVDKKKHWQYHGSKTAERNRVDNPMWNEISKQKMIASNHANGCYKRKAESNPKLTDKIWNPENSEYHLYEDSRLRKLESVQFQIDNDTLFGGPSSSTTKRNLTLSSKGQHQAQIAVRNGIHHWQSAEHSKKSSYRMRSNVNKKCPYCEDLFEGTQAQYARHCRTCKYSVVVNHKIVAIRHLDYVEDVYDLVVDQYHNYATSAGVFVHNTVDLCRIYGALPEPEDQVSLTTAGNYLDSQIESDLLERYPKVQVTKKIIRDMKETYGYADSSFHESMFTVTEAGKPVEYDVNDILQSAIRRTVRPICEAVKQLIAEFDPEFQEKLRNNILVAGGGSRLRGIDRAIEHSLRNYGGGKVRCTEDPEFGGAIGALQMAIEMPEDLWEQV